MDRKLKKQIEQKAAEMQKIVREQEYFKEITQDQIDKKLRFLERAIGGAPSRSHSEDRGSESSRHSFLESPGVRESDGSAGRALDGPIYGGKAEGSAQFYSDAASVRSEQEDEGQEGHDVKDSKRSPSPSKKHPDD